MSDQPTPKERPQKPLSEILQDAGRRALGGGLPGAAAMAIQVFSLMWLRTSMNYQYRNGGTMTGTIQLLYKQGGVGRFYRGVGPALLQGPISRFGDTAANSGMLAMLNSYDFTRTFPVGVKTACASVCAGLFRIILTPVDTFKTIMQVQGKNGIPTLIAKYRLHGLPVFFHGAIATALATMVGHFPWFFTFNLLDTHVPKYQQTHKKLLRNAAIGFTCSVVSDTISNSLRVIKTTRQTSQEIISYPDAVRGVIEKDGILGLFGRGLKTRIVTNGLQGLMFTVLWKLFEEQYNKQVNKID